MRVCVRLEAFPPSPLESLPIAAQPDVLRAQLGLPSDIWHSCWDSCKLQTPDSGGGVADVTLAALADTVINDHICLSDFFGSEGRGGAGLGQSHTLLDRTWGESLRNACLGEPRLPDLAVFSL